MLILKYNIMKFKYFRPEHYHKDEENIIRRLEDSPVLDSKSKHLCLRECFMYYSKCENINELFYLMEVKKDDKGQSNSRRDYHTRCICSHFECLKNDDESGIHYYVVSIPSLDLKFAVGKNCYSQIFTEEGITKVEINNLFKDKCICCGEIITRKHKSRPNCCSTKCRDKYNKKKREELREIDLANKNKEHTEKKNIELLNKIKEEQEVNNKKEEYNKDFYDYKKELEEEEKCCRNAGISPITHWLPRGS